MGFPGGSVVKNLPPKAGDSRDMHSICGSGRSPGEGNSNMLQYSLLEKSMNRGAWRATVHGVTKSQTQLSAYTHTYTHTHTHTDTHPFGDLTVLTNFCSHGAKWDQQ